MSSPPSIEEVWERARRHVGGWADIDTESDGRPIHINGKVRGVGLGLDGWDVYLPVSHPNSPNLSPEAVGELTRFVVANYRTSYFHWKFDVVVLSQLGVPYHLPDWDGWPGGWLYAEPLSQGLKEWNQLLGLNDDAGAEKRALHDLDHGRSIKSLEDEHYYGPEGPQKGVRQPMGLSRAQARELAEQDERRLGKCWATYTYEDIVAYATRDPKYTRDLRCFQQDQAANGRPDITIAMPREIRWQATLGRMERAGIRVDKDRAQASYARATARMETIRRHFLHHADIDLGKNGQGQKVTSLVFERWGHHCAYPTPKGNLSSAKENLEALAYDPRVVLILEYRRLATARTRYYEPLLTRLGPDGRVHPSFGFTRNGRPNCREPNLLNIPRATAAGVLAEIKAVFVPEPGMELWGYDLAQAEPRVTAAVCRDPDMMAALNDPDRDAYQELADEFACHVQRCPRDRRGRCAVHRQVAKTTLLSYEYGAGDPKLALRIAIERTRETGRFTPPDVGLACTYSTGLRRKWPKLIQWKAEIEREAREVGRIELPSPGRYRHFRGPGFAEPYKDAANAMAQGSVAILVNDVQMATEERLADWGGRYVLNIYDELVAEVPPGVGPKLGLLLQEAVDDLNPYPHVRHVVESKRWS